MKPGSRADVVVEVNGTIAIGKMVPLNIKKCRALLVSEFGFSKADAEKICLGVALSTHKPQSRRMETCTGDHRDPQAVTPGHKDMADFAHAVPDAFAYRARDTCA